MCSSSVHVNSFNIIVNLKVNISNLGASLNCKQTLKSFAHFSQIGKDCKIDHDCGYLIRGQIFHSPLKRYMSQLLLLGKLGSGRGPFFKVVLEC